jgi:hypothetical protein
MYLRRVGSNRAAQNTQTARSLKAPQGMLPLITATQALYHTHDVLTI